uniref:Uncharacterized protein n=1 Tax=Anguilla anguilla TaxID=7936 RepID=A0A0E9VT73_ANGAN
MHVPFRKVSPPSCGPTNHYHYVVGSSCFRMAQVSGQVRPGS